MNERNNKKSSKQRLIISLTIIFSSFSCVSIGFSSWVVSSSDLGLLNGDFDSDLVTIYNHPNECFTSANITDSFYLTKYGFTKDGTDLITSSTTLGGNFTFSFIEAFKDRVGGKSIETLNTTLSNSKCSMKIDFSAKSDNAYYSLASVLTSTSFSISSNNANIAFDNQITTNSDSIYKTFKVLNCDVSKEITFSYNISITTSNSNALYKAMIKDNSKFLITLSAGDY